MKTFTTNFTTRKNLKTGEQPIWILKITINDCIYWLSDGEYSIPNWNGGVTTEAYVASWGRISERISGNIGEILVADLTVTIINNINSASLVKFQELAFQYPFESSPCELYLWFYGLAASIDPPQLMFRGYVKDVEIPDETVLVLNIEDETSRYGNYVGTKLTAEQFPLADPDHIGKLIPIVFGTVPKLPAVCVDSGWATTLSAEIGINDTTIYVSDLPPTLAARTIRIDDEIIRITAYNSGTKACTVTRGYSSSTKAVHTKGSTVIESKSTPLVYLLADHPLDSIGNVYARINGMDVDITSSCTKYLGTAGNQLAAHPGRAAVTVTDIPNVSRRINLWLENNMSLSDALHTHTAGTVSTTNSVSGVQSWSATTFSASQNLKGLVPGTYNIYKDIYFSFQDITQTILSCKLDYTITCPAGSYISYGGIVLEGPTPAYNNASRSYTFNPATQGSAMNSNTLVVTVYIWSGTIYSMIMYDDTRSASATVAAARTYTYNSTTSGNVSISSQPSGVTLNKTLNLKGNSVADVMIGDMLLADCVRSSVTTPFQCIDWLLRTYASDTTLTQTGTLPASYKFNGAITEYKRLIDWLDTLAFQSACWFRRVAGISRLITRYPQPASVRTITACALTDEGIKAMSARKSPISDTINTINLLYARDWSGSGATPYTHSTTALSAASIATYGEREDPSLFNFDFVNDKTMASDLAATYVTLLALRPWEITFIAYLDQVDLEFGDVVTLSFLNNSIGRIIEVSHAPGTTDDIDTVTVTALITTIPPILATALITLAGEALTTKDRQELIYV